MIIDVKILLIVIKDVGFISSCNIKVRRNFIAYSARVLYKLVALYTLDSH